MDALPMPSPGTGGPKQDGDGSKAAAANRRLFERHPVDRRCRITELDEQGNPGASWEAKLIDLSRGGAGLRSRRMVYQGRHLFVEIDSGGATKLLFGVVRQSRYSQGEGYAIGVEFRAVPQTSGIRNWLSHRGLRD